MTVNELETLRAELSFYKEMSLANSVNAFGWMRQHDKLLGFIQDRPDALKALLEDDPRGSAPSMADVPALEAEVARLTAALSDQAGVRLAEREACAKIASDYAAWAESKIDSDTSIFGTVSNTADDIAEMIRTQTAPPPSSTAGEVE